MGKTFLRMILIENDLYDIADRLKALDCDFRVYYDPEKKRFEVHGRYGQVSVLPFDRLDARAVSYMLETRIERLDAVICDIENHNKNLEKAAATQQKKEVETKIEDALRGF